MPRSRRRKIEVWTDTQPQFELEIQLRTYGEGGRERRGMRERDDRITREVQRENREKEEGREPRKGRKENANRHGY